MDRQKTQVVTNTSQRIKDSETLLFPTPTDQTHPRKERVLGLKWKSPQLTRKNGACGPPQGLNRFSASRPPVQASRFFLVGLGARRSTPEHDLPAMTVSCAHPSTLCLTIPQNNVERFYVETSSGLVPLIDGRNCFAQHKGYRQQG